MTRPRLLPGPHRPWLLRYTLDGAVTVLKRIVTAGAVACLAGALVTCSPAGPGRPTPTEAVLPYLDPDLPLERRVDDLISRMTLEEKVSQMLYNAAAVERLGMPEYNWWNEALHGVARAGRATVFPQAIGLAATWDTDLMLRVATVISDEARAKHHESVRQGRRGIYEGLTFWSPNINIFRDPRWGRGMETFGEDPYLTGRLAVEFVKGMQGDDPRYLKTVATPKHYAVHSGPEPDRHTFDAVVDERDLRETYLPAFRATVVDADAQSVMCAYNRFRGAPCCGSGELLQQILRDEWGFDGYVVSDCWAIMDIYRNHSVVETAAEAAAMGVASGTDLNCGVTYDSLVVAVEQGLISEEQIDVSLRRLLRARFRLGMFDPPERVPYTAIPYSVNDSEPHGELAVEATRKSIVLLKNDGGLLPLSRELGTIAVIGPNAADVDVLLGNYNGVPSDPVTPLEGIRRAVEPGTTVLYARGADVAQNMPSFEVVPAAALSTEFQGVRVDGLKGEYFANHDWEGEPFAARVDSTIDFNWWDAPPIDGMPADSFSIRWTGILTPPASGRYALGVRVFGTFRLFLDDSLRVEFSDRHVVLPRWADVEFETGLAHDIRVEYRTRRADAIAQLVWAKPEPHLHNEALRAAEAADAVILVMGLSPRLEGEEMRVEVPGFAGGDRVDIGLPGPQQELIEAVVATGKPVVLVLLNGSALAVNWAAEHVPAIAEAWYPGQAAGTAIADVLFGDYNPAGRLPVTFYRSVDQLPPFSDYDMQGRTYRYFEGQPLFPFGHGLSYTTFRYSNIRLPSRVRPGDAVEVSVQVENVGDRAGEEVVQLYLTDLGASAPVPIRSLQGFRRLHIEPGETKTVSFTLEPRQLSLIDADSQRVIEPGVFEISVGGKQPGFSGLANATSTGVVSGRFEVVGEKIRLDR
ncbi:MAG: glycoside hydrolase family 3 C-terminal domain-containing protein [Gemmatimonadota bacterium]|nr:MAG: glycoside hydrolase family 3 C-terminal domain-containing protein [Gemmatimonadota bacterium]